MSNSNDEEEWGMGWTEEEDHVEEKNQPPESPGRTKLDGSKLRSGSTTSMNSVSKFTDPKQAAMHVGTQSLAKGITSSPSFQELERAIGATLALSLNAEQQQDQQAQDGSSPSVSKSGSREWGNNNNSSKGGGVGFNITQQKLQAQRLKQQQQYRQQQNQYPSSYSPRHYSTNRGGAQSPQTVMTVASNARQELGHFVNESDSRAIILFHSPMLSPIAVRDACQKYGVLYYIRPEFHGKGVTLLSYFDLRAAIHAHGSVVEELGPGAEASSHYSVMLHAANNNSEEFRLEAKNLPKGFLETDVESIFSRYGQLRSIQKMYGTDDDSAQERDNSEGSMEASAFKVEYFNIQDARLAASELCATSAQLLGPDATVSFAPLDSRKQQLCRQLLATLSRWRSELAPAMSLQVAHHHHPHGLGSVSPVHGMGGPYSPSNGHGGGTLSPSSSFGMLPMGHMAPINNGAGHPLNGPVIGHDLQQSSFPGMYGGPVGMSAVNNVMSSSSSSLIIDQGGNGVGLGQHHQYSVTSGAVPIQHHMLHAAGGHAGGMQQQMQVNHPYGVGANFPEVAMQQQMSGHNPYSHAQLQQLQQHPGGHPFNDGGMNNSNIDGGSSGDMGQRMGSNLVSNSNDTHRQNGGNSNDGTSVRGMNGGGPGRDSRGQGSDPSQQQQQQQQWGGGGASVGTMSTNGNNNNNNNNQMMMMMMMMNNGNAQGVFPGVNNGQPMGMGVYLNNSQHQQQQHYTYGTSHHTAAPYHQQQQQHNKGGQPMSQQQQQAPYGYHQPQQQHQQQQEQQQSGGAHAMHLNGGQGQQQHRALPHHHNGGHTYGGPGSSSAGSTLAGPGGAAGGRRGPNGLQGRGGQHPLGMMPPPPQVTGQASLQGPGQQRQQQLGAANFAGSGGMMQPMGGPQQQQQQHPGGRSDSPSGAGMMSGGSGGGEQSNGVDFSLDLTRVKDGEDIRTTVMVRNIPNKYQQHMLLDEINVNHEGTYDFFYLPIDFKNKCNVGYCFINFLEPKCIVPFVKEFNGQRWKSFNSEKVCAITFARIQGKASMVARFQNSSLLEKDDEYRPLLFHSTGPERGKPESFPLSANKDRNNMVSAGGLVYIPHHTLSHHHHPDNLNDMGHGGHGGDASNGNAAVSAPLPPEKEQDQQQQHEDVNCPPATVDDKETLPPAATEVPATATTPTPTAALDSGGSGGDVVSGGGCAPYDDTISEKTE